MSRPVWIVIWTMSVFLGLIIGRRLARFANKRERLRYFASNADENERRDLSFLVLGPDDPSTRSCPVCNPWYIRKSLKGITSAPIEKQVRWGNWFQIHLYRHWPDCFPREAHEQYKKEQVKL